MTESEKSNIPGAVAITLLAFLVPYALAYCLTVETRTVGLRPPYPPQYRFVGRIYRQITVVGHVFSPIHKVDRLLRPRTWNPTP
jgi:hypothetical protein